jgi:hypothetical protein
MPLLRPTSLLSAHSFLAPFDFQKRFQGLSAGFVTERFGVRNFRPLVLSCISPFPFMWPHVFEPTPFPFYFPRRVVFLMEPWFLMDAAAAACVLRIVLTLELGMC